MPQWFARSIKAQLSLPFLVMLFLIGAMGVVSLRQIDILSAATSEIGSSALPKMMAVSEIERTVITHSLLAKRRIQTNDFRQQASIIAPMNAARSAFERLVSTDAGWFATPAEFSALVELKANWRLYLASFDKVLRLNDQGFPRQAQVKFDTETHAIVEDILTTIRKLVVITRDEASAISTSVKDGAAQANQLMILALISGVAATLIAMRWTERGISRPLVRVSAAMDRLAHGDDSAILRGRSAREDEIGMLFVAASAFRESVIAERTLTAEVNDERQRLRETVNSMPIGVCMFDNANELVVANQAFSSILDLPAELTKHKADKTAILNAIVIGHEQEEGDFDQFLEELIHNGHNSDGHAIVSSLTDGKKISILCTSTRGGCMMICEDVTQRMESERNIRHMARHDALTGLPNRLAFQDEIKRGLAAATADAPAAILFIDLDRFKYVNDSLGHPVGDALLKEVAKRLAWAVDEKGAVARFGGDEFAVMQQQMPQPDSAQKLADQIVKLLSAPIELGDMTVQIGASVGIAFASDASDTPDELLRHADLALYAAKEQGRGSFRVFDNSLSESQKEMLLLEQAFRQALRNGELYLQYQPILDLESGKIIGAEALVRWNHPEQGAVSPSVFVPLAEELGLVSQLGAQVLDMACQDAVDWPEELTVSVNMSPLQFHSHEVVEDVRSAVERAGLNPRRLVLEVTEGVLLGRNERTKLILNAFRQLGIQIALDDFGTGYSSLRYLQYFDFDKVKIDASFVAELPGNEGALSIVRSICAISKTFGFEVTAEGIENAEQSETVLREGATLGQGFFFAQPMSPEAFVSFVGVSDAERQILLHA